MSNGISTSSSKLDPETDAEIAAREQDVARADSEFSTSIQQASQAGKATLERAVTMLRPVLIGAAVLATGALVVSLIRSRKARVSVFSQYQEPSPWPALVRSAALALASAAGRRLADRWLAQAQKTQSSSVRSTWAS
jgi:hypothetical protein